MTCNQLVRLGRSARKRRSERPALGGCPQKSGVCIKIVILKPKKPNSADRKSAKIKLTNGEIIFGYIPGIGHSLQEHAVVLVQGGGAKDLACNARRYSIIRKGECSLGAERRNGRSLFGVCKPKG